MNKMEKKLQQTEKAKKSRQVEQENNLLQELRLNTYAQRQLADTIKALTEEIKKRNPMPQIPRPRAMTRPQAFKDVFDK